MKTRLLKLVSLLAALLMVVPVLFGCTTTTSQKVDPEKLEEMYPMDQTYDITILTYEHWDPAYERSWDYYGMKKIKDKAASEEFNLNLQFEEVVNNDEYAKTIVNTRMAAQVDVPDVIRLNYNVLEIGNMYRTGMLLNLSQFEDYMPNIKKMFEEWPSLKTSHTSPEGDILAIPKSTENIQSITFWGNIRKDWLDKLNLPVPATVEEFRSALKAFQDNNVSGVAGKKEQFFAPYTAMNISLAPAFGAYGIIQGVNSWAYDDKGQIYHAMLTDEAKAYVEYVAGMFKDGLFWNSSLDATSEAVSALRLDDLFAGTYDNYWGAMNQTQVDFTQGRTHAEYTPMYPLTSGDNPAKITHRPMLGNNATIFTSWCDAPHRVLKFYDWLMTWEGFGVVYYGEELPGGNYFVEEPVIGKMSAEDAAYLGVTEETMAVATTEKFKKEFGNSTNYTSVLGLYRENFWPFFIHSSVLDIVLEYKYEYPENMMKSNSDMRANFDRLTWASDDKNIFYEPLFAAPTEAEQEVLNEAADIFTYMDEMYKKFMMGIEPMSKWDEFVNNCNKMGLEDARQIFQDRYDRANKK